MNQFKIYFQLQLKRVFKICPGIICTTFLLCGCMCLVMGLFLNIDASKDSKKKVQIGLVGDISDSYLGLGIYALEHFDSSRFTIDFHDLSEEEARKQLESGTLNAYVRIPDGFIDSIVNGENKPITYVTGNGQMEIGSLIINELVETISSLITESQNAIYGMQKFMRDNGLETGLWKATDELNRQYIDFILNRTGIFRLEAVGISNDLSLAGYYFCAIFILFFLLWGINCSTLFSGRDIALSKLLASKGQGAFSQVLSEYLAYLLFTLFGLLCVSAVLILAINVFGFFVPEWEMSGLEAILLFMIKQIPVAAVISALQFFLYEIIDNIISAVILQFLCAICLGYISGCFYPIDFFPEGIQKLAAVLPTGAALSYLDKTLLNRSAIYEMLLLLLYLSLFISLSIMARNHQLKGEYKA